MKLQPIALHNRNKLAADYKNNALSQFFSYAPYENAQTRLNDLKKRSFNRQGLVEVLLEMNRNWDAPLKTIEQIQRLKDEESVVVIGGQQAGLLTGPTYTINKLISILQYAKEQEKKLKAPVIPVFWIAGEDHDFAEINHIYSIKNNALTKRTIKQQEYMKTSVSHIKMDKQAVTEWLQIIFNDLVETKHTRVVHQLISDSLDKSFNFVDFFAHIIYRLFPNEGIVLINSADDRLRKLEAPIFQKMIERQEEITEAVFHAGEKLKQAGYHLQVDISQNDANLFYHLDDERILLKRVGNEWIGKNEEIAFSTEQLLKIARNTPEKLSNNVITRPLMQESLFPTLAFIAGDGEISYWALLKDAFSKFDENMNMPPILPRLSFTYVTARIEKLLKERALDPSYIVNNGCEKLEMNWLSAQQQPPFNLIFEETKKRYEALHEPLQQLAKAISDDLGAEAERNWSNILKELEYLEQKTKQSVKNRYLFELSQFQEIANALRPNDVLQERVLNIIPFINECGLEIIERLVTTSASFEDEHYLVYF